MLCPYCLQNTSAGVKCNHCKEDLPPLYTQQHLRLDKSPAVLSAVGFSGHGKTVYLAAMLDAMATQLPKVWPGFFRQGLDDESVTTVKNNLAMLRQGVLPESTRRNFPRPSAHRLNRMPQYGNRDLLIYDPPGEAFEKDIDIERFAHFIKQAKVVLFLISVNDLDEPKGVHLYRLLEMYNLGMARVKAKTKYQHLIVAYTKADLLVDSWKAYPVVRDHLSNNEYTQLENPHKYLRGLKEISESLLIYTRDVLEAQEFINATQTHFKSVTYCAVSALGHPPDEEGHLIAAMQPRCVLDPLFWVLEYG